MKVFEEAGVARIVLENEETAVGELAASQAHTIIVEKGAKKICAHAFRRCANLKKLYLPETIVYLGEGIFQREYSEVEILYAGSSEQFQKIDMKRDTYVPGPYDHYPYYSSYGASYHTERFYARYDNYDMWCEVVCEADGVRLTYGSKTKY